MAPCVTLIHRVLAVQNVTTMSQSCRLCTYCIFNLSQPLEIFACWTYPRGSCVTLTCRPLCDGFKGPQRFNEYLHILLVKLIKPSLQLQTSYFIQKLRAVYIFWGDLAQVQWRALMPFYFWPGSVIVHNKYYYSCRRWCSSQSLTAGLQQMSGGATHMVAFWYWH